MKGFLRRHGQVIVNAALFLFFFDVAVHQVLLKVVPSGMTLHEWWWRSAAACIGGPESAQGLGHSWYRSYWDWSWLESADWSRMAFHDWSFTAQTVMMTALILLRRPHASIDKGAWRQAIALAAFCSGIFFVGLPSTESRGMLIASGALIVASNVIGLVTMFNLGRSFGIMIALRKVKTGGLYRVVRHPMYAGDILLRTGYVVSHFSPFTAVLLAASTAAYVYRAVLEERFLSQDPEYKAYAGKVKYRFVPFVY